MPDIAYILAVLAIVFTITLGLRALPFAALAALRESSLVSQLAVWMPAGILAILAASTFRGAVAADAPAAGLAVAAVVVTVATHLLGGRRTLLSVGAGTLFYVLLLNAL